MGMREKMRVEISIDFYDGEHRSSMIEAMTAALAGEPYLSGRTVTFTFNDCGEASTHPVVLDGDGSYTLVTT